MSLRRVWDSLLRKLNPSKPKPPTIDTATIAGMNGQEAKRADEIMMKMRWQLIELSYLWPRLLKRRQELGAVEHRDDRNDPGSPGDTGDAANAH